MFIVRHPTSDFRLLPKEVFSLNKKNYLTIGLLLIVLIAAVFLLFQQSLESPERGAEGSIGTLMAMEVINGEMISEDDFISRPTLVVKWTTWCRTCIDGLFYLKETHEEFQKRVNLVAVNITRSERNFNDVTSLLERADLPFLVLADREGKASQYFQSIRIPAYFLIDTDGELVQRLEGIMNLDILDNWLEDM